MTDKYYIKDGKMKKTIPDSTKFYGIAIIAFFLGMILGHFWSIAQIADALYHKW